jgi:putative mRNA 3-end processing factor
MVKISFLGACREVGRSAVLIESSKGDNVILDYGIRFSEEERLPQDIDVPYTNGIALSHCHVDHSGGLPYLYKRHNCPLYTNPVSLHVTEILLRDMINISKYPYPFGMNELQKMRSNARFIENGITHKVSDNIHITFYNAGHIPGSVSILVNVDDKRILYTGDFNTIETNLIKSANFNNLLELDAIITESTYALKEHPPRQELEREFIGKVIEVVENGGNVLIPAFGVSRSQEILLILNKFNFQGKIYLDGLAREVSKAYMQFPTEFKNYSFFNKSLKRAHYVKGFDRKKIIKKSSSVIISPSGMLKGGAAIDYVKKILHDPYSAIYFVGYQVEGNPGRTLLDDGVFLYEDRLNQNLINIKAECDIDYFDFSSHADKNLLHQYANNARFKKGDKLIFCVHGDEKASTSLANEFVKDGYTSVAPEIGESYTI